MSQAIEELCREVYEATRSFYADKASQLGRSAYGFRILYGPPIMSAPILFIGYQPGGTDKSAEEGLRNGEHEGWPASCDYATAPWTLATRLREVFGRPLLERCTGLNAIFVRAPSMRAWNCFPPKLRNEIEGFSLARAEYVARALKPQRIVAVGLGTFDRLTTGEVELRGNRRVLVKRGELWDAPVYGVVHLSGARVSCADIARLATYFAGQV